MFKLFFKNTAFILFCLLISCRGTAKSENPIKNTAVKTDSIKKKNKNKIIVGANQTEQYLKLLRNKKIGIVGNQTSVIFKANSWTHLVDSLLALKVNVTAVFAPEHGFRGEAAAGETVKDGIDRKTGIPIISLYGDHKKPTPEDLKNIDLLVFDIQDVGVRFYTYISTLHYVMEACAEHKVPLLILDRPNPNGSYIDGPILEPENRSFIGMDPVPIVHGMTIGEYAKMINGEGWLQNQEKCDLKIIPVKNYNKNKPYSLPIKPSPNLPNDKAVNLYPSLCFFEGTNVNAGRGTNTQFQVFGSPDLNPNFFDYQYVPKSNAGAKHPKHEGKTCYGRDLRKTSNLKSINLQWLIEAYRHTADQSTFFNSFFVKLAGTKTLQKQIENGLSEKQIKKTWQADLEKYNKMRQKYFIY